MSRVTHMCNGAGSALSIELRWFRWGGGANPGMTHVFTIAPINWVFVSLQCVTDDFGSLVVVED